MDWRYIAGFFDGEGCINLKPKGGFRVSMSQTRARGLTLFVEMKEFLKTEGKYYGKNEWKQCYILYVDKEQVAKLLLTKMLPHLRIKRTEAQDAIRFLTLYPNKWTHHTFRHVRISEGVKKYWQNRDPLELAAWKQKQSDLTKAYFQRRKLEQTNGITQ